MMRFTVIDPAGAISFVGPGHCLKAITAGCSRDPKTSDDLFRIVRTYDARFVRSVLGDLAVFDEFVVEDQADSIDLWLGGEMSGQYRAFRILNQQLRNLSLMAEQLGIVLFNLVERRIVQIQNAYGEVLRSDRGRIRIDGRPVNRYYHYSLPDAWSLVP
jgi:hypothetical protein